MAAGFRGAAGGDGPLDLIGHGLGILQRWSHGGVDRDGEAALDSVSVAALDGARWVGENRSSRGIT